MASFSRKSVPDEVRRQVLIEAGYRCGVPTCRNILAIDLHHLVQVTDGGASEAANLLALCPTCHALYHRGTYSKEAVFAWKQVLVSLSLAFDQGTIDLLLFLHKMRDEPRFLIQSDALLQFARLIGNDLAVFGWMTRQVDHTIHNGFCVSLSTKGRNLIEAWMKGDRIAVARALSPPQSAIEFKATTD